MTSADINQPELQICIYNDLVTMTRYENGGSSTYPVSGQDIAAALADIPVATGFLPPNTLSWQRHGMAERLLIYLPPRRHKITVQRGGQTETFRLPFPPALFCGEESQYSIWAVQQRPEDERAQLYHFPSPNVGSSGSICTGNVSFPICTKRTIRSAFDTFISSQFNSHLAKDKSRSHPNILDLWCEINGRKRFPLTELLPTRKTLSQIL